MSSIGGLVTARVVEGVFFSSCFLLISFSFLCRGGNGRHEGKQCCDIWLYLSDSKFYVNSHLKRAERCHTDPKTFHLKAAQQPIRFYIQQIYRQTRVNVWFWEDMSTSCLGYAMIHNPSRLIPSLWKYGDSRFLQKAPTCAAGVFAERFSAFQGIFDPSISPVGPLPLSLGDGCLSLESQIASLSHHCDLTLFVSFRNVPTYLLFPPFSPTKMVENSEHGRGDLDHTASLVALHVLVFLDSLLPALCVPWVWSASRTWEEKSLGRYVFGEGFFSVWQLEFFLSLGGFCQTVIPSRHQQKYRWNFVNFKDLKKSNARGA